MIRLVGNPESIPTEFGDSSIGFDFELEIDDYRAMMSDKEWRADVDKICGEFLKEGYVVDRIDALYAWIEVSMVHSAHWLSLEYGEGIVDAAKIFLVKDD